MRFEWGSEKAAANLRKHRISFDEAATASTLRIIGARLASASERKRYET
jgi:uncharacterized DUF497 family protein